MLGTWVNVMAIIAGSGMGLLLKKGLPENIKTIIMDAIGLGVLLVGLKMALLVNNIVVIILSLAVGAIIGECINIELYLNKAGNALERKMKKIGNGNNSLAKGFVAATLLYCVGAMAVTGAIQSGLTGDHSILFAKSVLDGITAVVLTTTMGLGVIFSGISVLIYQGSITLLSGIVQKFITEIMINEMTAVGGLLIFAIGLNILEIKKIRVGNLLPALIIVIIFTLIVGHLGI
jgi:hypothetical protein